MKLKNVWSHWMSLLWVHEYFICLHFPCSPYFWMIFCTGHWWLFGLYISIGAFTGKVTLDINDMMRDTKQSVEYILEPLEILTYSPDKTHQKNPEEHPLFLLIYVITWCKVSKDVQWRQSLINLAILVQNLWDRIQGSCPGEKQVQTTWNHQRGTSWISC